MSFFITVAQIIVAIALILLILLQERSAGAGGIFGGGEGDFYHKRRGLERTIFIATIALAAVFVVLAVARLLF